MRRTFTVGLALLLAAPAGAQRVVVDGAAKARIDSTLRRLVSDGKIAGVSALVWERGREAYFGAFGLADREAARPMRRDAIAQIFSMTKPVTGVALMTLYEQGKFALDDPAAKYLPELANVRVYAGADAAGKPILVAPRRAMTVRDLTRHTAGFATGGDNPGVGPLLVAADPGNRNNTLAQEVQKLGTVPLWFHPGEKWAYGPAVDVQALLVERLSGMPFEQYVRRHVLDPLGMRETRYVVPERDRGRLAAMYQRSDSGVLTRAPDSSAFAFNTRRWPLTPGSWGLTSTVDDYMRFARMLVNGGALDGVRVLKPETVKLMATNHLDESITDRSWLPSKGQVGFGVDFAVRLRPPATAAENNGTVGEFFWDGAASTLFWVDPVNWLTAVLFVQLVPFDRVGLHKGFRDAVYGPLGSASLGGSASALGVDHVIVGIDSLERGIALLRAATGVAPAVGGVHPGRGTRNALLSLGDGRYLELMAPDPAQPPTERSRELSALHALTPIGWAAKMRNADSVRAVLVSRGVRATDVTPGSRRRPDGSTLRWRTIDLLGGAAEPLPFFIEWDPASTHPSSDAPGGCTLADLAIASPAADSTRTRYARVGLGVRVEQGARDALSVTLACPAGRVRLGPAAR